jgi:hypothetical protein
MKEDDMDMLGDLNTPVNVDNEEKLWKFLETRLSLLLRAYDTTAEVFTFNITSYFQYIFY